MCVCVHAEVTSLLPHTSPLMMAQDWEPINHG